MARYSPNYLYNLHCRFGLLANNYNKCLREFKLAFSKNRVQIVLKYAYI